MNQRDRILNRLRIGPACGTTFLQWSIPRYSARINELRNQGHRISRRVCKLHHHQSTQYVYELDPLEELRMAIEYRTGES